MNRQALSCKFALFLAVLLLASAVVACSPRSPTVLDVQPGQAVDIDGWKLVVSSVRWLEPDAYRRPSSGRGFLAIELSLENTTQGIRYVMPERQMLALGPEDARLQPHPAAGVLAAKQRGWLVVQGEIGPGQKLAGAVSYEVPLDLAGWRWVFRPKLLGSNVEAVLELEGLIQQ